VLAVAEEPGGIDEVFPTLPTLNVQNALVNANAKGAV
jgi:hypothetical protein